MIECKVLHHKLLRLLLNSIPSWCCVSIGQFSPFSPTSGCRLDLEFRALFHASADFGYFRRGAQSVLFRAVSGSFIRPVLLSTHVSSQDQKSVCGLLELLVPATSGTLHFTLPCRVLARCEPRVLSVNFNVATAREKHCLVFCISAAFTRCTFVYIETIRSA